MGIEMIIDSYVGASAGEWAERQSVALTRKVIMYGTRRADLGRVRRVARNVLRIIGSAFRLK